jgi:hypothetical protein
MPKTIMTVESRRDEMSIAGKYVDDRSAHARFLRRCEMCRAIRRTCPPKEDRSDVQFGIAVGLSKKKTLSP